ncbi:hypothetical protein EG347_02955 [Chryseobacterium sp. G0186]|nr:hypothetical protein EG347_02955 [Chryseobacterium sp. G0186]
MKIIISIIFIFLLGNACIAQPLRTSVIAVDSIFYKKQHIYFNLKECIERLNKNTYPIIIKNFPCDCFVNFPKNVSI